LKEYSKAEEDLHYILKSSPYHYSALICLADLYFFHLDKKEEALQKFKYLQKIYPHLNYPYRIEAAYELIIKNNSEDAFKLIDKALKNTIHIDQVYPLYMVKSQFYKRLEKHELAEIEWKNAVYWPETQNRQQMKLKIFAAVKRQFVEERSPMDLYLFQYENHYRNKQYFLDVTIITIN
jgi:tetratricopeptide (TPR) repeat protein